MKCPTCEAEGQKSHVYVGGTSCTLLHCPPFYDEDGNYHHHDRNARHTSYSCSRGHHWKEKNMPSCWCGWPNKEVTP